jgi:ribosomal-protein-alanine N-acetyltransferase
MIVKDGLVVRAMEINDLAAFLAWNSEEGRGEFMDLHFKSIKTLTDRFQKDGFLGETEKMVMLETEEKEQLGIIFMQFKRPGVVNIGMSLCQLSHRFQGYGTQATVLIVDYLFKNFPLARIEAETDMDNLPAQKVLEKAGFHREGILRNYYYHHGKWRDFVLYSILPGEVEK